MKKYINILIIILIPFSFASCALNNKHTNVNLPSNNSEMQINKQTFKAEIIQPTTLKANKNNKIVLKLIDLNNKPLLLSQIKEVHTKKVHWLIVDETLSDYHHLHPIPAKEDGTYTESFIPKNNGNYKIWVDITPINGKQQYLLASFPSNNINNTKAIDKKIILQNTINKINAKIEFKNPLKVGVKNMGKVTLTNTNGKPITDLEPVMGAFSHIVGFYEDFNTTLHAHPMGKEPTNDSQRGGPEMLFGFTPEKAGFLKIFVQVKHNNKDVFIPFGVHIDK